MEEQFVEQQYITGSQLREMIKAAAALLESLKEDINALNVFPVPDGDTGTNMSLTLMSAWREVQGETSDDPKRVAAALSRGALKGARGNSGVILSQLFRGFAKGVGDASDEVTGGILANALTEGVSMAYKAVMKPKEGTILTVARAVADAAQQEAAQGGDPVAVFNSAIASGEETLRRTPDMLPVLKQAGVVDSGGKGLMVIYAAFRMVLTGQEVSSEWVDALNASMSALPEQAKPELGTGASSQDLGEIEFGYCTEFFIRHLKNPSDDTQIDRLRDGLAEFGDSLVVVGDTDLIKVHVHSNEPGRALQLAIQLGELSNIKIDNMREQHRSLLSEAEAAQQPKTPEKDYGICAVAAGKGLENVFMDLGVDHVILGGQTMNPSIEDIAEAVNSVNAKCVFVLPNNSNIIMAAQQAEALCEGKQVVVLPTKSIPQGISAVLAFHPERTVLENQEAMVEAYAEVKTGQVTYAVRDSSYEGGDIHEGEIMGLMDGKIVCTGSAIDQTAMDLVGKMATAGDEIVTVFYGEEIAEDQAQAFVEDLQEAYPECEIELYAGGQPLYYYLFSVE